jgi:uncharacterized membrane protein YccC
MLTPMRAVEWVAAKDPDYLALRRAIRAAIVAPISLWLTVEVIGNPAMGTFAVFGSLALLILVDIPGPVRQRLTSYALLALTGCVLICLSTPLSQHVWSAAISMTIAGFAIVFVGVISSVLAASTTVLLLAWILPVTTKGSVAQIPERVAGWGLGCGLALIALATIWPAPATDPLRGAAAAACQALAERLRGQARAVVNLDVGQREEDPETVDAARAAMNALRDRFRRTAYRPVTLTMSGRAMVRMVDELDWVSVIANQYAAAAREAPAVPEVAAVWDSAAAVLAHCAAILQMDVDASTRPARVALDDALERLDAQMQVVAHRSTVRRQLRFTSCEPSFRGQELSYAARQVGRNVQLMAAADARSLVDLLLGRMPTGMPGTLNVASRRARAHLNPRSVWLHNSVRSACALGIAVYIALSLGVQHSFWVVFGVLAILRSTALSTGQNVLRGLVGTVLGFVVGGVILLGIGTNPAVLWTLLPITLLAAGFAPAAISFLAGQAAFTLAIVILFNIIQPAGWRVGLIRVEDIAIGCAVSLAVGLLFWPRGAATALGSALGIAYRSSARYLARAVDVSVDGKQAALTSEMGTAVAAFGRLDDAFRQYLAERGAKPVPIDEATSLVTGTIALRLAGDAVVDLWRDVDRDGGGLPTADHEVIASAGEVERWYDDLAASLTNDAAAPPEPSSAHQLGVDRWAGALAQDDRPDADWATVRLIWTADHLDAVRRLQPKLVEAARVAVRGRSAWLW